MSNEIRIVDKTESQLVIETRLPLGKFMVIEDKNMFIGIDNSSGDAFVESFSSKRMCVRWLNGEFEIEDLNSFTLVDHLEDLLNNKYFITFILFFVIGIIVGFALL